MPYFRRQSKQLIAALISYFERERDNGGPLLPLNAVRERVADALNVSIRTVSSISQAVTAGEPLRSPKKSKLCQKPTTDVDHFDQVAIRNTIYDMIKNKRLNVLYEKNWTRLVTEQLKRFERAVIESSRVDSVSNPSAPHWTFGGALLYSLTLLTTVGYGRLSPRTTMGKAAAMIYAVVGVPLMLVLLSALGSLLAGGAKKGYTKLCCKNDTSKKFAPSVGYHRAPSSPSGKHLCHSTDDTASVQLMPTHCVQNNINHKSMRHMHFEHHMDHQDLPKKALLATVRSSHTRGRCVQGQVRQMLADPQMCPSHSHGTPSRTIPGCTITLSDVEETDDNDENDGPCTHDTPSRMPLIWRAPEQLQRSPSPPPLEASPSVPAVIVILFFAAYVCLGAAAFASTSGWSFLDAAYFCFIALSTIGIGDKLPQSADYNTQIQLLACCIYLFFGLVIVAMCFSLVHEEVATKCKQFATSMRLVKH